MSKLPPLGLYVHYPFCRRKCPYCDFNSYPKARFSSQVSDGAYTKALLRELEAALPLLTGRRFISVFLGGGTPSLWPLEDLSAFLAKLQALELLSPQAEISMEVNPGTAADAAYFKELRALGVNRLSIGVQSFDDKALRSLGRIHDAKQAQQSCAAAREAGFARLNLDIMHGLPGQDEAAALRDLDYASRYATHLSWYELTLEEDSYFGAHPPVLPDEDTLAQIEEQGFALLHNLGFKRYEISGFTQEQPCVHNLNYWRFGDYLGLGAGAHSKISRISPHTSSIEVLRHANPALPDAYLSAVQQDVHAMLYCAATAFAPVAAADLPFEYMLNRLRLFESVPVAEYEAYTGLSFAPLLQTLKPALDDGLVTLSADGSKLNVTATGHRLLNSVLELFLNA